MVRMMEGVITHGTATRAAFGRPAAGKTGTTQNWRDAWFMGFTPDWMCGVWIGNDDNTPMNKIVGGAIPAEIWRKMMILAHQNMPVRDFSLPPPEAPTDVVASDAAPSAEPAAVAAAPDNKAGFYNSLGSDFANAQHGPPPAEPPKAHDDADDNDDKDQPPARPAPPPPSPQPQP